MKVRIFQPPGQPCKIVVPVESVRFLNESDNDFIARVGNHAVAADPTLQGLPFVDVEQSALPADRAKRHQWKIQGQAVVIDPLIPSPPHPKQALLDQIAQANNITDLKTILRTVVKG